MNRSLTSIRNDIRALSPADRETLLRELIADLDTESDPGAEAAWIEEAHRRLQEIEAGSVTCIPADEVFERVQKRLVE